MSRKPAWMWVVGTFVGVVAVVVVGGTVDGAALGRATRAIAGDPVGVVVALTAFGAAFVLRAAVWRRVLPGLSLGQSMAGIHVALGANHVLPLRLGEPLRVVSVVRRTNLATEPVVASTVTLRLVDIAALGVVGCAVSPVLFTDVVGAWGWLALAVAGAAGLIGLAWLRRLARRGDDVRVPLVTIAAGAAAAWLLEAAVVWQAARWTGLDLDPADAVLVTAVAVAAQLAAVAPAGFGTYEAAAVAAYVALGFDPGSALAAALIAHGTKTAYSLVAGGVAVWLPRPAMFGRLRLAPEVPSRPAAAAAGGPVVLFMPAFDEERTVAGCVANAPSVVDGHPVEVVVVDDGSVDSTADRAAGAGAVVISHGANRGLGAAVRTGLAWAVGRDAVAVAFCDADGEYRTEDLADLVGPILAGDADYVAGSRLAGQIVGMLPHRRVGNVVLSWLTSFVARRRLSDAQTGYRALSPAAAAAAEIIHDFNYAQVLTLDLLAKGFRYTEVPIRYRFRTEGRSFVRLPRYLASVVPAVHREVNGPLTAPGHAPVDSA